MIKISPSILSCDFSKIGEEIIRTQNAGADMIHIDVMDGHFVPNLTFGAPVISKFRKCTKLPFDVHLMITDPQKYIDDFAKAGADIISVHYESNGDIAQILSDIRSKGISPSIVIKPKTLAQEIFPYLDLTDMVLVMTVEPGFGGQSFMHDMLDKISQLKQEIDRRKLKIDIQVDGGINRDTAKLAVAAGANILVAGNALFTANDMAQEIKIIKASDK